MINSVFSDEVQTQLRNADQPDLPEMAGRSAGPNMGQDDGACAIFLNMLYNTTPYDMIS